jgi:hypothetical protein
MLVETGTAVTMLACFAFLLLVSIKTARRLTEHVKTD